MRPTQASSHRFSPSGPCCWRRSSRHRRPSPGRRRPSPIWAGRDTGTFWLFNGGLILAGLIGLPFGWRLWQEVTNRVEQIGVAILGLSVFGMVAVGIFFLGHTDYYLSVSLHGISALLVFLGAPVASWVYGYGPGPRR
ncbi:MAG: DUF998 domain-containing protein [Natrialbaceae archaeon]|nr:DUF998 domain-containing protein [Natrialbaceae archaeon]